MIELIRVRSLILWWGLLTSTFFLQEFLKQVPKFLRDASVFDASKLPFSFLPSINAFLNDIAQQISGSVKFDPNNIIVSAGPLQLPAWGLSAGVALALVLFASVFYYRAIRSSEWWDDALALIVFYTIIRIVGHLVAIAQMPIDNRFRALLDDPNVTFVLMLVLTGGLVFIGEGFRHKRTFWRSLISISIVALFMFPKQTAGGMAAGVDGLIYFGGELNLSKNPTFTVVWGALGMALALQRLTFEDAPAGGGGGGAKGGGGGKEGGGKKGGGLLGGLKLGGSGGGGGGKKE